LGTRILASLINSGRYVGIERSNSFLEEINKEQIKQRSGAIDDSQISQLGKQFGVKYVCIADITPAFGSYQLSARIVDVETAVVISIGETFSPLKFVDDFKQASDEVVRIMLSERERTAQTGKPAPTPKPTSAADPAPAPESALEAAAEPAAASGTASDDAFSEFYSEPDATIPPAKPTPPASTVAVTEAPAPKPATQEPRSAAMPAAAKPKPPQTAAAKKPIKTSLWIGLGAETIGVAAVAFGAFQDSRAKERFDNGTDIEAYNQGVNHVKIRDIAYWFGIGALLSGISIQIFF
jgi:hypothetical protein